jgi:hypothetical protein
VKDGEGTEIIDLGTKQRHSLIVLLEIISLLRNIDPDAQQLVALLKDKNWCIITNECIELRTRTTPPSRSNTPTTPA